MHGGATATVFDFVTSMLLVLVAKKGFWELFGVSRTLDVVYLEPIPHGEEVELEAELVKLGFRLGISDFSFRSEYQGSFASVILLVIVS